MKIRIILVLSLTLVSCSSPKEIATDTKYKVIDGDTVHINNDKYRLACVDAPEVAHSTYSNKPASPDQAGGPEAKQALINIINKNGSIKPGLNLGNSYGRTVSTLTTDDNKDVALLLAQQGWVQVSDKYRDCPNIEELDAAQLEAQTNRLGIWDKGTNIQSPSDFRKSH
jgi:endonuclease YncB( thermonuclease family)